MNLLTAIGGWDQNLPNRCTRTRNPHRPPPITQHVYLFLVLSFSGFEARDASPKAPNESLDGWPAG